MTKKFKCMIVDAGLYIDTIRQEILKRNNALSEITLNHLIQVCLSKSLAEVFCLPIIYPLINRAGNRLNDFELFYYSRVKTLSDSIVFNNVDRKALSMFDGFEIICFLNNRQLFLLNHNEPRH